MKAHKPDMYAAWARENGIPGMDHWDPKVQEKNRMRSLKYRQRQEEKQTKEKDLIKS